MHLLVKEIKSAIISLCKKWLWTLGGFAAMRENQVIGST